MKNIYDSASKRVPLLAKVTVKQFIKFSLVGVSNTAFDFSIYIILTRAFDFNFLLANAVAFTAVVSWSYMANKWWTFRDTSKHTNQQFTRFIMISIVGLLINEGILLTLVKYFDMWDLMAKLIAVILVVFWNFWANRTWTFTDRHEETT